MNRYFVLEQAEKQIEDIYAYSVTQWGSEQADVYLDGLYALFENPTQRKIAWRSIPAEYRIAGYFDRYQSHVVCWRDFDDGVIGIAAVLHDRMDLRDRLNEIDSIRGRTHDQ